MPTKKLIGLLLLVGAGIAAWYFLFKKAPATDTASGNDAALQKKLQDAQNKLALKDAGAVVVGNVELDKYQALKDCEQRRADRLATIEAEAQVLANSPDFIKSLGLNGLTPSGRILAARIEAAKRYPPIDC